MSSQRRRPSPSSPSAASPRRLSPILSLVVLLVALISSAHASALTTTIQASERTCFYALVDKVGEKVQSGGSFDIDWTVTDPKDTIVIEGERERQGDYIFTAHLVGEYSFCFSNDMSSFSEKLVDFDIMVESEPRPVAPAKPTALTEQTSSLEESIYKLSGSISSIQRTQKYFRTRENRNVSTVQNTQWRIFMFSISESVLMCGMSAFQVWGNSRSPPLILDTWLSELSFATVVQRFFSGPSRRRQV
ncbi:hypothetical protein RQP46_005943 [Phenoliferia psychrophenolica]